MGFATVARRAATGLGLALLGVISGFVGGLFRRRTPSDYVSDRHAPPADPAAAEQRGG